jgi:glucose-1-phosphate thymidylyltransferase
MSHTRTAVVLAAGRGTRMRQTTGAAELDDAQRAAAARGEKAMMPVGRPFLDHVLHRLAEEGIRRVCVVIRPEATAVVQRYETELRPTRLEIAFARQAEPRGTAHAVLCAATCVGGDPFLLVNGDNLYPVAALTALAALDSPGLIGFEPAALVEQGNVPAERIPRFALIRTGRGGRLERLVEKPNPEQIASMGPAALVSMNAWRFDPAIFAACRAVEPSDRGELELQEAVSLAMASGQTFTVLPWSAGVLDLTGQADVAGIAERLHGVAVRL